MVHELGHDQPNTTKELLYIANRYASSEEAVGAVFMQSSGKEALGGGQGATTTTGDKAGKRSVRSDKRGLKQRPWRVAVATYCDEGINNKDAYNSNKELVTSAEHDFKCQVWQPVDHFEKLLKVTCLNHTYPIKHKLKECTMMKNYMTT
jgi:hypothetical protein